MSPRLKHQALVWVEKAKSFYNHSGKRIALAEFSDSKGAFVEDELYIFVLSTNGTMLAHGVNEKYIGRDFIDVKDSDGRSFIREIVGATRTKGSGMTQYKWFNPVTKEDQIKHVYFEKVDDVIICGGVYGDVWEELFGQTVLYHE